MRAVCVLLGVVVQARLVGLKARCLRNDEALCRLMMGGAHGALTG